MAGGGIIFRRRQRAAKNRNSTAIRKPRQQPQRDESLDWLVVDNDAAAAVDNVPPNDSEDDDATVIESCSSCEEDLSLEEEEEASPDWLKFDAEQQPLPSPVVRRRVRFSVVQIQEYALTMGDHPFTDHFPLSLDWAHAEMNELDLSTYEASREYQRHQRSSPSPSSSSSSSSAPRLCSTGRCLRLAAVTGTSMTELAVQNQKRQRMLQLEEEENEAYLQCYFKANVTTVEEMTPDDALLVDSHTADYATDFKDLNEREESLPQQQQQQTNEDDWFSYSTSTTSSHLPPWYRQVAPSAA